MKRTYLFFGMIFLFSFFLLTINAWGAPYISFNSIKIREAGIHIDIDIVDTNGKNLRNLTNHPALDCCAAWAPDGRSFAFVSDRDGNTEIYIKTFNVDQVLRLTNHPEGNTDPALSPDGNWIAFMSTRTEVSHIYKIDINGNNLKRLTHHGKSNINPAWSPDGQSIAFESIRNGREGIYVIDADGKNPRQIINPLHVGGFPSQPTWSPDGKQIACTVAKDGVGIYIMDTDGQNARRISPLGTWSGNPAWSPDGKWIAYDAHEAGENPLQNQNLNVTTHIFIVSVEGASHGKSHNILGNTILPHGFPEVFSPFLRLWTPRRPSGVG